MRMKHLIIELCSYTMKNSLFYGSLTPYHRTHLTLERSVSLGRVLGLSKFWTRTEKGDKQCSLL